MAKIISEDINSYRKIISYINCYRRKNAKKLSEDTKSYQKIISYIKCYHKKAIIRYRII